MVSPPVHGRASRPQVVACFSSGYSSVGDAKAGTPRDNEVPERDPFVPQGIVTNIRFAVTPPPLHLVRLGRALVDRVPVDESSQGFVSPLQPRLFLVRQTPDVARASQPQRYVGEMRHAPLGRNLLLGALQTPLQPVAEHVIAWHESCLPLIDSLG